MAKNQMAVKEESAMVMVQDDVPDYIKNEQRGSENVGQEDVIIPRLEIVQALSPAMKEGDPGYIPEARAGMLMNSVTKQLYGKEVVVIPVIYMKQHLVWKARKDKQGKALEGGFFGAYNSEQEARERAEAEGGEAGNIEVIDTPQHLCLLIDPNRGTTEEVMISMPRTKAKISRQWNSMIRLAGGDRFSRAYKVSTALEKKAQGDYYNFAIAQLGFPNKALYLQAEALYNQVQDGRAIKMDVNDYGPAEDNPEVDTTNSEM